MLCTAHGGYPLTFTWEKDKKSLNSFGVLQKPYPSSILLVTLKDKESFRKYICHMHDGFSKKTLSISVEELSTGYYCLCWFYFILR